MAKKKKNKNSTKQQAVKTPVVKVVAKEPKKVVEAPKKEVVAKEPKKVVKTRAPKKKVLSEQAETMKTMLSEYKDICCRAMIPPSMRAEIVNRFVAIVNFATNSAETDVLDLLFGFFIEEKNGLMGESLALSGISKLGPTTTMKVETLYAALRICVGNIGRAPKKKTKLNLEMVREKLGEKFVAYLATK